MHFGTERELLMRLKHELSENVVIVHQVEERKTSVPAWRRENFKECIVFIIRRIVVTAAVEVAATNPRLELTQDRRLIARFCRQCAGLMVLGTPRSELANSPKKNVDLATRGFKVMDVMASERRHVDRFSVRTPCVRRAVV